MSLVVFFSLISPTSPLTCFFRYHLPRVDILLHRPSCGGHNLHRPFDPWHASVRILPLRISSRCRNHANDVESEYALVAPSQLPPTYSSLITQTIDWTYIFYALNYQLAAILLACSPRWYLYQALGSNFLWILPWAIVVTKISVPQSTVWTYYAIIFGGALVFDFFDVGITVLIWAIRLMQGKVKVRVVQRSF